MISMQHRTRRQLEWTASEWSIISCIFVLDYREGGPPRKNVYFRTLPSHATNLDSLILIFRCNHNKKYSNIFSSSYFNFLQSRFEKVPFFNLIQFKAFSTPDASVTWEQICRELSIVKETVRQSHFLGRGDSRFFQVAGNHLIINYPCLSPGNYPSYQTSNGREWCTDPQTGWRVKFIFLSD